MSETGRPASDRLGGTAAQRHGAVRDGSERLPEPGAQSRTERGYAARNEREPNSPQQPSRRGHRAPDVGAPTVDRAAAAEPKGRLATGEGRQASRRTTGSYLLAAKRSMHAPVLPIAAANSALRIHEPEPNR
jgi:hypothetical protein